MKSKGALRRAASTARAAQNQDRAARSTGVSASGVAGKRRRKTHSRSAEIIDAAARVFAERGYHGTTTQHIADVLGIRQASLYYYFPSKEVALEIVCTRALEAHLKVVEAVAAGPGTAKEKLTGFMRAHISAALDRRDFVKVFLSERKYLPPESRRRSGKYSRAIEDMFESVIREGARKGEFRSDADPRMATLAILGMTNTVWSWYAKEGKSIERIENEFAALLLAGLATRPPPTGASD
jgi:TetR/AcrR family transcriptional regulator, cholesterol catabolism regulator